MRWYDQDTKHVKLATHACFDGGMNNLPINKILPNVKLLQRSEFEKRLPASMSETSVDEFHLFSSQFAHTNPKVLKDQPDIENFGLDVDTDGVNNRAVCPRHRQQE